MKNPDGSAPPESLIHERAAKVALHELGHLLDLLHCEHKKCLMHFSGGTDEVDEMSLDLCEYCSIYLLDKLR
jgi:archaemetzincin